MFNRRTTFIVGAGASDEFGLPVGSTLKERISGDLRYRFDFGHLKTGDKNLHDTIIRHWPGNPNAIFHSCITLSSSMEIFASVDEAINHKREDENAVAVGKMAIINRIAKAERESKIYGRSKREIFDLHQSTWLYHFLSIATRESTISDLFNIFSNVTIINFNYDRIIEHYLYNALTQRFQMAADQAAEAVSLLKIVRPYGSIGALPELKGNQAVRSVEFGSSNPDLFGLQSNIKIYTEAHSPEMEDEISNVLNDTELLCFLGFGFHKQNMNLLSSKRNDSPIRSALCTCYGIDRHVIDYIKGNIDDLCGRDCTTMVEYKCGETLSKLRVVF